MNVELPDGTVVEDIPEGISKLELAKKLKANGMAVPDEWLAGQEVTKTEAARRGVVRGAGHLVRGLGVLGAGPIARVAEMFGNTEVGDKLFAAADDFAKWGEESAKPVEGEKMSETAKGVQKLAGAVPALAGMAVMGPVSGAVMAGGGSGADTYASNLEQGVDNTTALKQAGLAAGMNAASLAIPAAIPGRLAMRLLSGGAANAVTGEVQREAANAVYGEQYPEMQQDFSPGEFAADLVLGAAIGGAAKDPLKGKGGKAKGGKAETGAFPADKMEDLGDGKYRTPNGVEITKEDWESNSQRVREGWLKPKPVEEKIPTGETKELSAGEAAAQLVEGGKPDTSAIDKVLEQHPTGPIAEAAKAAKAKKLKAAEAAAKKAKDQADAADMRRAAATIEDPDLKAELLARAEKLDKTEKIPVGEVKEGQPDIPVKEEKIPVGEVREGQPDIPVSNEKIPAGEITAEYPEGGTPVLREPKPAPAEPVPVGEARELYTDPNREGGSIPKGETTEVEMLPVGEVKEGQPDIPVANEKIPVGEAAEMIPTGEATEIKKIPVGQATELQLEKQSAPGKIPEQEGVRQERGQGNEGRQTAEAGVGDRVQRAAESERKGTSEETLDLGLPKIDEAFMREQERVAPRGAEARAAAAPDERGRRHVRAEMDRAVAEGRLDKDVAATAAWALDKNPNLAAGLKLRAGGEAPRKGARGAYDDAHRVVEAFKGTKDPKTLVHEILHHSERMMPQKVQDAIRREWRRRIEVESAKTKDPERKALLADIGKAMKGDVEARERLRDAVVAGKLDYHLVDPSEFWAVNAAQIFQSRHGSRNAWHTQARQWLREMIEHVKSTIGLRSDAPVLKALDEVLNPKKTTGVDRSPTMLKKAAGADDDRSFAMGPAKRTLGDETRFDVMERRLFDRFNRVAKLQQAEAPKTESADAYQADQLYHGRLQHRGDRLERDFIKPLGKALKAAKKAGITVRDADDYLMALHAPERNAAIAQRNPKMQDGGSGLTNQQAKDIIDGFTPEQRKHLDEIAKLVHDLNRTKLDTMVDDGLISAQTRDALNQQFKKYVPLKTLEAEDEFTGAGRGYAMRANDIVAALGRKTKASSPIAASVMDASRAAIRGEKARVERAIWEYAQNKDAHDFIKPYDPGNPPPEVMDRKIGPDGKVKEIVSSKKVQDLTIPMVVNGEDVRVFVPDQLLRDQLMKITQTDPGPVLATIARGTSMIGRLLTEFNPTFTIPNAVKDAITVAIRAGAHDGVSTARVMANIPKAWKTIIEYKVGAKSSGAAEYEEFLKAGGKTGAYGIQGVADTMRALEKAGAELGYAEHKAGYARRVGRVLKLIPRAISGANEVLEYASRFAMYKEMRRTGATPAKSAAAAKEITVNFNRSGDWGRNLNSVLVFANAALQGLRNTAVYLKSPHVRKGAMGLVALGAAVQYWNEQMGGENEETGELNINSQHDAVADKNVVMLMPGQREGFKIPMPPEYAFPYLLGRRLYRAMSQGNTTKEVAGIAGGLIDTVLPVRLPEADSGALAVGRAVVPTLAAPVAEVWLNQSYFGTPIVPEQHGRTPVPYHTMSRATTSELAKSISEIANSVTGGDNVKPGLSQKVLGPLISPEGIEHLTKGYTGGVGATVMQAKNLVNNVNEGKPVDINKVPVVSRFAFQEPQSYTGRRYRELAEEFDQAVRYRKAGEWDKIAPRVQASLEQYEVAEKELRVLFKELREAGADGADRESIQQRIKAVQSRVIKAYNKTNEAVPG